MANSDFVIEAGVSLPVGRPVRARYPFAAMAVGDSFFIKCEGADLITLRAKLAYAASQHGRRNGGRLAIRRVAEGLRCWRTA